MNSTEHYAPPSAALPEAQAAPAAKPIRRPLIISVVLAAVAAGSAWVFDVWLLAFLITSLCMVAVLWNMVCLLYYAVRWNRRGLKLTVLRLVLWVAAMFAAIAAHNQFTEASRARAESLVSVLRTYHAREGRYPDTLEALVPRDLPAVPTLARGGGSQKFRYRKQDAAYTLSYVSGWMTMTTYDSATGKWETVD